MKLAPSALLALGSACSSASTGSPESDSSSASASALRLDFDDVAEGALPAGWRTGATRPTATAATWRVVADPSAPSPSRALALGASDDGSASRGSASTFNLCWTEGSTFADGTIEVSFRADAGEVDQGGGPIWRVQGPDDYYVCRANPLESNFRVYYVAAGARHELASAEVEIASRTWHRIRVEHVGNEIACFLDGVRLLEATDDHLPLPGGVGLWTKADALTSFDDLWIEPR